MDLLLSKATTPNNEVVQDVALCLRSFCGERVLISYEKFCERFKKSVGYSLKEHLMKCSYNFEQLIDQVSRTTRTKCKYNAVLKVISILPDQGQKMSMPVHSQLNDTAYVSGLHFPPHEMYLPTAITQADVGALLHPDIFVQTDPVLRDFCEQKDAVDPLSKMNSENTDDRVVRSFTPTPVLWSYNDLQSTSFSSAGDGDDTFFDAEDGCSSCSVSGDKNAAWLSSKSRSEHESVKYDCRTCDNLGDGTGSGIATGPKRHKRKRSASCNDVGKRRNSIFAWSTGSALEMRLCSRLTFELIEGPRVPCGSEPFSQRCIIENVHDDLRCGSRSTIVSWLPGRAAEADTSRRTFKVHLRKNVLEESALYAPYPLTESLQNLKLAHPDGPTKDDCPLRNKPTQPEKISMTISRAEVKKECIRLWGSKVKKLEELLLFLQLFHRLHGPVLITECEELLESCAAQGRTDGELSWEQYGEDMDVRRFFEMKMFTMSEPPNRMKVQPVDIILNAGFRILPSGLPSALYNYMVCSRRAPVSELLTSLEPFLKGLPNLKARLDKILLAARMIPDAIVEVNEGLELVSDHEFFVVTDIN